MVTVMDINDIRGWHTVVLLISFVGIVIWAYSKRRKSDFDEAANLPFADEKRHQATMNKENLS
jgi:cytochrome c oxidase cbb3-type subunit 4